MTAPVIAGFHPDPTVVRVGDEYFLANSSFEYRPGVPLHRSTDLRRWELIGHALSTCEQLPDSPGAGSSGVFAPTLRHHDGRFWLITTNVTDAEPEQMILHAERPEGPWSAPVATRGAPGIDPDLAWDGDACYLTWALIEGRGSSIAQARIDPVTGRLLEEPRALWSGSGMAFPEGPHLIHKGDWWYLLIAEGGTERGHAVSIARSRSPEGPFEGCPANPILSHRSTTSPVQNTGHADLVERPDGSWAMVYLGVRPRGTSPGYHVNGRETFLAEVEWIDDWPVVRPVDGVGDDHSFDDRFDEPRLHPRWVAPGVFPERFARRAGRSGLVLEAAGEERFLGVRTRSERWRATASLRALDGAAGLELRLDAFHRYAIEVERDRIIVVQRIGSVRTVLAGATLPADARLSIRAVAAPDGAGLRAGPDEIVLSLSEAGGVWRDLARLDGRYLSTEVAGGFTGRLVGVVVRGRAALDAFRLEED